MLTEDGTATPRRPHCLGIVAGPLVISPLLKASMGPDEQRDAGQTPNPTPMAMAMAMAPMAAGTR
jgi:hypothetical protein